MEIVVLVKQVPGTSSVEVDPVTGVLKRDGVPSKMNPYDLYALELGLGLAEEYGGRVTAVTMGPPQAELVIRETIMMGASGGVIISDRRFAGADVLSTSFTLAEGIKKLGRVDLILSGKQTTDGDTAQVGPEVAEHLSVPHITNVEKILSVENDYIKLVAGQDESIITGEIKLPCLLCTEGGINTPRLPSYRRGKEILDGQITYLSLMDMDDNDERHYGLSGSPTQVVKIFPPEKGGGKELWEGDGEELGERLHELLVSQKFI